MNTYGITKIQTVVYEVMNDLNQTSLSDFKRYLQWAIRAFKKLNIYHLNSTETFIAKVDSKNTIDLPNDYIAYRRIGFIHENKVVPLSYNENIINAFKVVDGQEKAADSMLRHQPIATNSWLSVPNSTYNIGFYKEDKKNNRLIFEGDLRNLDIIIEYVSTGVRLDAQTYIPEETKECLIAFIHWQRELNGGNINNAAYRERIYTDALDELMGLEYTVTPDEFIDAITSGYSQLPG